MSTRCNIIIKDACSKLYFYRHSDGYPEGAMPVLEKFLALVKAGKIRDNVGQAAGWLIILGASEYDVHGYSSSDVNKAGDPRNSLLNEVAADPKGWKVGSIEPTDGLHSDIEHLYIIDLDKREIFQCHDGYGGDFEAFDVLHN